MRKMGLFNPQNREEQARSLYCENARFQEILRENKRKNGAVRNVGHIPVFGRNVHTRCNLRQRAEDPETYSKRSENACDYKEFCNTKGI